MSGINAEQILPSVNVSQISNDEASKPIATMSTSQYTVNEEPYPSTTIKNFSESGFTATPIMEISDTNNGELELSTVDSNMPHVIVGDINKPALLTAEENTSECKQPSRKKRVGVVRLERQTKSLVARYPSVAVAASSLGVTYKQLYSASHSHCILDDSYWHLVDADLDDAGLAQHLMYVYTHIYIYIKS